MRGEFARKTPHPTTVHSELHPVYRVVAAQCPSGSTRGITLHRDHPERGGRGVRGTPHGCGPGRKVGPHRNVVSSTRITNERNTQPRTLAPEKQRLSLKPLADFLRNDGFTTDKFKRTFGHQCIRGGIRQLA